MKTKMSILMEKYKCDLIIWHEKKEYFARLSSEAGSLVDAGFAKSSVSAAHALFFLEFQIENEFDMNIFNK